MKLTTFLAEIGFRARGSDRLRSDLITEILSTVHSKADDPEGKALAKACIAIIECDGEISGADLDALSGDSLVLIDRFAAERLRWRYKREHLDFLSGMLKEFVDLG